MRRVLQVTDDRLMPVVSTAGLPSPRPDHPYQQAPCRRDRPRRLHDLPEHVQRGVLWIGRHRRGRGPRLFSGRGPHRRVFEVEDDRREGGALGEWCDPAEIYRRDVLPRPQRCAQGTAAWPRSRSARLRSSASARVAICHVSCGSWSGGCSRWPSATRTPCRHRMPIRWPSAEPGPTHVIWTSHRTGCTWTIWSTPSAAPRAPSGRNPAPSAAGRTSSTTASR